MVDRAVIQPRIQLLGVDEAPAAGTLLAASHANYPAFRVVFPDSSVRSRVLLPFQAAAARDAARYGRFVGALLEDRLARVALWQPPGRFPLSFVRKLGMAPGLLRAAIGAGRALTRFANSGAALEQAFPREPDWYLQALGVHPSAQHRGVGAALLRDGLALVDADNARCHLHTSDAANVQYYKRWGFELTQPAFSAGAGGPTYYGMTRPASRSSVRSSTIAADMT